MDFIKKNMLSLVIGVLLLAGIYVYMIYFAPAPSAANLSESTTDSELSQKLLITLQNLHTIKLDPSIFSDLAFESLTDFGVTIQPEPKGRPNPFLPVGVVGSAQTNGLALPSGGALQGAATTTKGTKSIK